MLNDLKAFGLFCLIIAYAMVTLLLAALGILTEGTAGHVCTLLAMLLSFGFVPTFEALANRIARLWMPRRTELDCGFRK